MPANDTAKSALEPLARQCARDAIAYDASQPMGENRWLAVSGGEGYSLGMGEAKVPWLFGFEHYHPQEYVMLAPFSRDEDKLVADLLASAHS